MTSQLRRVGTDKLTEALRPSEGFYLGGGQGVAACYMAGRGPAQQLHTGWRTVALPKAAQLTECRKGKERDPP